MSFIVFVNQLMQQMHPCFHLANGQLFIFNIFKIQNPTQYDLNIFKNYIRVQPSISLGSKKCGKMFCYLNVLLHVLNRKRLHDVFLCHLNENSIVYTRTNCVLKTKIKCNVRFIFIFVYCCYFRRRHYKLEQPTTTTTHYD